MLDGAHVADSVDVVLKRTVVQGSIAVIGSGPGKDSSAICDVL